MYSTFRIQLSSIYRFCDLPQGLEHDLQASYPGYRLVSDFPHIGLSCPPYLEVESNLPDIIVKNNLRALLMAYGIKEKKDFTGQYYS